MKASALIFLLALDCLPAEQQQVVLVQELVRLEAMEKKTIVRFPLAQQNAQLLVRFSSKRGGEGVRAAVYMRGNAAALAESAYELSETITLPLQREREYRVELENLRQRLGHALVDVEVKLIFSPRRTTAQPEHPRTLDPERKAYTIAASLFFFLGILAYCAARLSPPVLARWKGER
ncbi:MAG TPA: hypothetical protein VFQ91_00780 [Bryobacteraceae bacterium]|nr:hypothetical protein [Bryobacteraceae bacterium]